LGGDGDDVLGASGRDAGGGLRMGGAAPDAPPRIVSTSREVIKVWEAETGAPYTSIQPGGGGRAGDVGVAGGSAAGHRPDVRDTCVFAGTGLILAACDDERVHAFYVPSLGPAPAWCSHLDALTEEADEAYAASVGGGGAGGRGGPAVAGADGGAAAAIPGATEGFDDYAFLSEGDLGRLGMSHLRGTPLLRAHLHGWLARRGLVARARALADPDAYERYRDEKVRERLEAERRGRIAVQRRAPRVNAAHAARQLERDRAEAEGATGAGRPTADGATDGPGRRERGLADPRFAAMFEDPRFAIDEEAEEYAASSMAGGRGGKRRRGDGTDGEGWGGGGIGTEAGRRAARDAALVAEHFTAVDDGGEGGSGGAILFRAAPDAAGAAAAEALAAGRGSAEAAIAAGRTLGSRAGPASLREEQVADLPASLGGGKEVTWVPKKKGRGGRARV